MVNEVSGGASQPATNASQIPATAAWLGGGGLIPFIGCAVVAVLDPGVLGVQAIEVAILYGAVILSFLGGVFWGVAVFGKVEAEDRDHLLVVGVLPSLVAWFATFLPNPVASVSLSVAFLAVLVADRWAAQRRWVPGWWMRLRMRLSVVVFLCLVAIGTVA